MSQKLTPRFYNKFLTVHCTWTDCRVGCRWCDHWQCNGETVRRSSLSQRRLEEATEICQEHEERTTMNQLDDAIYRLLASQHARQKTILAGVGKLITIHSARLLCTNCNDKVSIQKSTIPLFQKERKKHYVIARCCHSVVTPFAINYSSL